MWQAETFSTDMIAIRLNNVMIGSVCKYENGWIAGCANDGPRQRKGRDTPQKAARAMWGNNAAAAITNMQKEAA